MIELEQYLTEADRILERIWDGRNGLRDLGVDPGIKNVEIVLSVDAHMRIMAAKKAAGLRWMSIVSPDPEAPLGIRIFGLPVSRDPSFADHEIRFRSEVAV